MRFLLKTLFLFLLASLWACTDTEDPKTDFGLDYQPLEIGMYWKYEVSETIVFGENDTESASFFYRDVIDYIYLNAEQEEVFVFMREKSLDGINWIDQGNFAFLVRKNTLIQIFENLHTVNLVFPPTLGLSWNANIYNSRQEDEFKIDKLGSYKLEGQDFSQSLKVLREEDDDEITFRDNRYAVYAKEIGMIEEYYEVYTYCSRNDCLGQQIIDSGRMTHLKIIEYGKN